MSTNERENFSCRESKKVLLFVFPPPRLYDISDSSKRTEAKFHSTSIRENKQSKSAGIKRKISVKYCDFFRCELRENENCDHKTKSARRRIFSSEGIRTKRTRIVARQNIVKFECLCKENGRGAAVSLRPLVEFRREDRGGLDRRPLPAAQRQLHQLQMQHCDDTVRHEGGTKKL